MNPASYEWIPDSESGVYPKWVGSFTERNTRIGFSRIEAGLHLSGGLQDAIELMYLIEGRVFLNQMEYGPQSAFEFQLHEGPVTISAVEQSEFLRIVLPKF